MDATLAGRGEQGSERELRKERKAPYNYRKRGTRGGQWGQGGETYAAWRNKRIDEGKKREGRDEGRGPREQGHGVFILNS